MLEFLKNTCIFVYFIWGFYYSYKLTSRRMSNLTVLSSSAFGREKKWASTYATYCIYILIPGSAAISILFGWLDKLFN